MQLSIQIGTSWDFRFANNNLKNEQRTVARGARAASLGLPQELSGRSSSGCRRPYVSPHRLARRWRGDCTCLSAPTAIWHERCPRPLSWHPIATALQAPHPILQRARIQIVTYECNPYQSSNGYMHMQIAPDWCVRRSTSSGRCESKVSLQGVKPNHGKPSDLLASQPRWHVTCGKERWTTNIPLSIWNSHLYMKIWKYEYLLGLCLYKTKFR